MSGARTQHRLLLPQTQLDGSMARFARVVAAGFPHHVTQRGNARRFILETDAERSVYLGLLVYLSKAWSVTG